MIRSRTIAAALTVVAIALSGCTNDATTSSGAAPSAPLPTEVPPGTKLVIADQSESLQSALRISGELDKLPFQYQFANFVGGPAILEAFRAGAADVAPVGDVPPIHALAAKQDVPIIAGRQTDPKQLKLAVAPGKNVKTLADLRGKKIAYAEGTAQQAAVLRAIDKAGLQKTDVELVRLQLAEFPDAVRTGQVDVAPLVEPNVTRFSKTEGASFIPDSETAGIYGGFGYLYARREVLNDPAKAAALRALVAAYVRAYHWINNNQAEWAQKYYVDNQKISADNAKRIVDSLGTYAFPHLDAKLVARQQETIDAIDKAGELPRKIKASDGFDLRFDEVVTKTVAEIGAVHERRDS